MKYAIAAAILAATIGAARADDPRAHAEAQAQYTVREAQGRCDALWGAGTANARSCYDASIAETKRRLNSLTEFYDAQTRAYMKESSPEDREERERARVEMNARTKKAIDEWHAKQREERAQQRR